MPVSSPSSTRTPPDDLQAVQQYFSRGARRYHQHATLQRQIAQHLATYHLESAPYDSILELGCGTGFLTQELCSRFPQAVVDAIDIAPEMIQLAKENLSSESVRWHVADMNHWCAPQPYDLVASSTALHWANPLDALIQKIRSQLTDDGRLVAAVMTEGTLAELHQLRQELEPAHKPKRLLPSEPHLRRVLAAAQFDICHWECKTYRPSFASSRELFHTLRRSGFTGGAFSSSVGRRLVRAELEQLIQRYQQRYADRQGRVHATFQVIYFNVRRAH